MILNSVLVQCARGKSSIARNPEDHTKIILSGKKLFKNVTLQILDFKFYPNKLTDKNFPIWCNVNFLLLFCIV